MYSKACIITLKQDHLCLKPQAQFQARHEAIPARLPAHASPLSSIHAPPGNAIENSSMRYNVSSTAPITGATWFRRGLQSSVGHTEDQLPRKSNWKRNSRQRRQLRPSRLIPARLCTGFLVGRVRTARQGCRVIRTRSRYAGLLCASAKK